jgi:hypothetical protein
MQVALEPTGLEFRPGKAAILSFDYSGTNAVASPGMSAKWFDPSASQWVTLPNGVSVAAKSRFNVQLEHFSYYALAR